MSPRSKSLHTAALIAAFSCAHSATRAQPPSAPPPAAPAEQPPNAHEDLNDYLAEILAKYKQPGMVAAVFDDARILAIGVAGVRALGRPDPLLIDDRMHIGSCTKAVTATMLAALVEENVLWWDMPLDKALPDLAGGMHESFRKATIEQFLQHNAGLPPFTNGSAPEFALTKDLAGSPREQRLQFVRRLLEREPDYAPGSRFAYSNADFSVAAVVAESLTDQSWEDLIAQRVFVPLDMTNSGFGWPATAENPDQPFGHVPAGQGVLPLPIEHPYRLAPSLAPAGDVHCSIMDFARFAQFHLAGILGRLPPAPGQDRPAISHRQFMKLHLPNGQYAMGWLSARRGDSQLTWHNGSAGTFFSLMTLDPDYNIGVVVITNAGTGDAACEEVTKTLMDRFAPQKADN